MGSRTISLEQSAYDRLAAAKRPGESFSDVVKRLTGGQEASLLDLVGALPSDTADALRAEVDARRAEQQDTVAARRRRLWPGT